MNPDGRTDGMDGRTHGRRQNYIPPTLSGDNNTFGFSLDFHHICLFLKIGLATGNRVSQYDL